MENKHLHMFWLPKPVWTCHGIFEWPWLDQCVVYGPSIMKITTTTIRICRSQLKSESVGFGFCISYQSDLDSGADLSHDHS